MPNMPKIQITHFVCAGSDLFAIDNEGRVWKRPVGNPGWMQDGEVPDEPSIEETRHDQLRIDAREGLDEEKPRH